MKQKLLTIFVFVLLIGTSNGLIAQNYLDIAPNYTDLEFLNDIIAADTTTAGERTPNRVYRLEVGGVYNFNNVINAKGWDLRIVAEGDPVDGYSKAIILTLTNDAGKTPSRFAQVDGSVELRNLYFSGISDDGLGNYIPIQDIARVSANDAHMIMDGCYVEWPRAQIFRVSGINTSLFLTNNYINNMSWRAGVYSSKIVHFEHNPVDTVIMQNNTFVNIKTNILQVRHNFVNFVKIDHNTLVNSMKWPFHFERWTDAEITNNIFYNVNTYGENSADIPNQDTGGDVFGVINIMALDDSTLATIGMSSNGERKMEVRNNVYYFEQAIDDYITEWSAVDSTKAEPWMNERSQGFADDDVAYPNFNIDAPIVEDVGFVNHPTVDSLLANNVSYRTDGTKVWWWVDEDEDRVLNKTDRPWNLRYSETSAAFTAADNGLPLGDLNWYPELKPSGVKEINGNNGIPNEYKLSQNYPNPFNPKTNIEFSIPVTGMVTLKVFNILGQEVAVLLNEEMVAGTYKVDFDASHLSSAIYIYSINSGNFTQTKKMMLMK